MPISWLNFIFLFTKMHSYNQLCTNVPVCLKDISKDTNNISYTVRYGRYGLGGNVQSVRNLHSMQIFSNLG